MKVQRCTETKNGAALVQDCPDSARAVVADQLARSTLLADNLRVKSKVHPKYKTKYHVGNWPEYEQALVRRGDVTLWLSAEAMDAWRPAPSGRPGGPRKFSDVSIMTALMLRLVFGLPLRQTEGFLRSVWSCPGGLTWSSQQLGQFLRWFHPAKCLSRPVVEHVRDLSGHSQRRLNQVRASWKVLAE